MLQRVTELSAKARRAHDELFFFEDVQHREGGGACQRIPCVSAAEAAGQRRIHDVRASDDR
jgi:hypothetical protein